MLAYQPESDGCSGWALCYAYRWHVEVDLQGSCCGLDPEYWVSSTCTSTHALLRGDPCPPCRGTWRRANQPTGKKSLMT